MLDVQKQVQEYYGQTLDSNKDLKTDACCLSSAIPKHHKAILSQIHEEVLAKFYGCGSPLPSVLRGQVVLDLGCGTGRDVYLASALVGEQGQVIGVDMTAEQLEVAKRHQDWHAKQFGFASSNVQFHLGSIEDLAALGIADQSVDVVISNCVLNLSADKQKVFSEIFRVLKPGGELYFSDVLSKRRVPEELLADPVLRGECLSGALYIEDLRRVLRDNGCLDYRVIEQSPLSIDDPQVFAKIGMVPFLSMTIRAFKLASLEDLCEDYGQVATYLGGLEEAAHQFLLDDHHLFEKNKPMLVCGNTAAMLSETRFAPYFQVQGDRSVHYGVFDCSPEGALEPSEHQKGSCC